MRNIRVRQSKPTCRTCTREHGNAHMVCVERVRLQEEADTRWSIDAYTL